MLRVKVQESVGEPLQFSWIVGGREYHARTGPGRSGLWLQEPSRNCRSDGTPLLEWRQIEGTCDWSCARIKTASARAKFRRWLLATGRAR